MEKVNVNILNSGSNSLPTYSTVGAAGFDLRADFKNIKSEIDLMGNMKYSYSDGELIIKPFGRVLVPTNIQVGIPDGYEIQIRPRSGLALKNGIMVLNSPGTIDCDYHGFIGVIIYNSDSDKNFVISQGDRICQGVLNEVKQVNWVEVKNEVELGVSERGQGGFGHTGQN